MQVNKETVKETQNRLSQQTANSPYVNPVVGFTVKRLKRSGPRSSTRASSSVRYDRKTPGAVTLPGVGVTKCFLEEVPSFWMKCSPSHSLPDDSFVSTSQRTWQSSCRPDSWLTIESVLVFPRPVFTRREGRQCKWLTTASCFSRNRKGRYRAKFPQAA